MQPPHQTSPMTFPARLAARTAQVVLVAAAAAAAAAPALAALGVVPWLTLPLTLEGGAPVEAGPALQIGLAALLVVLCGFLPASGRVMRLETSHRRFHVQMEDVAWAYYAAHAADRQGAFRLANEFDAVRERLAFLRGHPELGALEPEVLELAAQMSHVGRDLARIYSDERVAAAREALAHRGDQAARIEADVARATRIAREIADRLEAVEVREACAESRVAELRAELDALLPRLGLPAPGTDEGGEAAAATAAAGPDDPTPARRPIVVVNG